MPSAYATFWVLLAKTYATGLWRREPPTNVPALRQEHPEEEDEQRDAGADPSIENVRCRLIEESLVSLSGALAKVGERQQRRAHDGNTYSGQPRCVRRD